MKAQVRSETRLELRIVNHCTVCCQGVDMVFEGSNDAGVLVLVTTLAGNLVSEEVVAVSTDVTAFLRLTNYARHDGGLTLGRDL